MLSGVYGGSCPALYFLSNFKLFFLCVSALSSKDVNIVEVPLKSSDFSHFFVSK